MNFCYIREHSFDVHEHFFFSSCILPNRIVKLEIKCKENQGGIFAMVQGNVIDPDDASKC